MTEATAEPCVVCGTTGGYVPSHCTKPSRSRGACRICYGRLYREGRAGELDRVLLDAQDFLRRLIAGEIEPDDDGCIRWPGAIRNGYGVVNVDGSMIPVTHAVLEATVGPQPSSEHQAAHAPHEVCGNRDCVAADHLRWDTRVGNMADKHIDGTLTRGEQIHSAKLTRQEVREIRDLYASGHWFQREIAEHYGVTFQLVSLIVNRKVWKHLP